LIASRVFTLEQPHSGIRLHCIAPYAAERTSSIGSALLELRRLSGITWEQLPELFGVSRRSLHFWASGKPQNSSNERRVQQLLATPQQIDRGNARENRVALFAVQSDGVIPFNLLREERYDDVIARLGRRMLPPDQHAGRSPRRCKRAARHEYRRTAWHRTP
jgi:transcriptional regulator with XRE-family HTH domain